jgi:hypothetical protein
MATVTFRVDTAFWAYGDRLYERGEHELQLSPGRKQDRPLLEALACAAAAGAVEVLAGDLPAAVEPDELSRQRESELRDAAGDDAWAAWYAGAAETSLSAIHENAGGLGDDWKTAAVGRLRADLHEYRRRLAVDHAAADAGYLQRLDQVQAALDEQEA